MPENPTNPPTTFHSEPDLLTLDEIEIGALTRADLLKMQYERATRLLVTALACTMQAEGASAPTDYIAQRAVGAAHRAMYWAERSGSLFNAPPENALNEIQTGALNPDTMGVKSRG